MLEPIPADLRSRLRGLRLRARRGGLTGIGTHASRSRGTGLEFAQYRAYEPGDELRAVDWKLYARSDRFFVREAERESPLRLWIVIDASASMTQGDFARPGWSRFDAARRLAACLAELALAGGDRFGWIVLGGGTVNFAAPANGTRQRDRMRIDLANAVAGGGLPDAATLALLYEQIGEHDLVVFLGDLFDAGSVALVERLAAARREVAAIQILTADERDFDLAGGYRFVDAESGAEIVGDAPAMRADFLARFAAARAALAARLAARGIALATHFLDEPADAALRMLFGGGER